ncbi:fumarylacetoacetate hydrolase family protein [Pyruvatibacter sp.]|uniref:fumarylacetoacetate hydrolase family protein n=1 Tax=Pyruvatibacter sp. TaxID=1981328 RepID=UPI003267BA46
MRIASLIHNGHRRLGVVDDRGVRPVPDSADIPDSLIDVLPESEVLLERISKSVADVPPIPLEDVSLLAPIPMPGKILAIGLNYRAHVAETGREVSPHQIWFNKQRTCIAGPHDHIDKPVASDMVDYEGELVVVIGKRCRHVPAERAHEVIAGYMVGNDVSVRDWQRRTPTMQMGKSFDTHGPIGPWMVTADEIEDPQNLTIKTLVNGEERQSSNTSSMIHSIRDQIEHLTTAFTLEPGDLIFTGTPEGVGAAMDPPQFLKDGDVVRIEIGDMGAIENRVADEVAKTIIG